MRPRAPTGIPLSRVETAQTIRASLLATAIAALLCPRERWTFRAQARSLSGGLLLTLAARRTARPPCVRSVRR